jgi:hypothetical protein
MQRREADFAAQLAHWEADEADRAEQKARMLWYNEAKLKEEAAAIARQKKAEVEVAVRKRAEAEASAKERERQGQQELREQQEWEERGGEGPPLTHTQTCARPYP